MSEVNHSKRCSEERVHLENVIVAPNYLESKEIKLELAESFSRVRRSAKEGKLRSMKRSIKCDNEILPPYQSR